MPTRARAVVLPGKPGPLRVEEVELPDPGPHQVVVRQSASGICHTQLHQMEAPRMMPTLLGHESTGIVMARGSEVPHVREGDRVVVTWLPRSPESASRPSAPTLLPLPDGTQAIALDVFTWADYTIADEQFVVKVEEDAAPGTSAVIGCAVMTGAGAVLHTAGVGRGESVAIFGVGGVGLCAVAAARAVGADPIIAVDLDHAKLELARRFGATHGVDASKGNPVPEIHALTTRKDAYTVLRQPVCGVDYAFDCVGLAETGRQALGAVRAGSFGAEPGGTAVLVAATSMQAEMNAVDMLLSEKRLTGTLGGSCRPERDFPTFFDWHRRGVLDLDALVTERYAIEEINDATDALAAGRIRGRAILEF
jgi:Zn-dependent alcohol dehydrogenase